MNIDKRSDLEKKVAKDIVKVLHKYQGKITTVEIWGIFDMLKMGEFYLSAKEATDNMRNDSYSGVETR